MTGSRSAADDDGIIVIGSALIILVCWIIGRMLF